MFPGVLRFHLKKLYYKLTVTLTNDTAVFVLSKGKIYICKCWGNFVLKVEILEMSK